jgi:Bacterial membrane protein YfhO
MIALHALPLFDITLNERLAFGAAFALTMLAAFGAEEIARRDDRRAARGTLGIVFALLFAGTIAISHAFVLSGPGDWGRWKVFAELALLAAAAILFALRIPTRAAILGVVMLLLVQRTLSEGGVHRSYPARAAYPPLEILRPLEHARPPFRVVGHGWSLVPATGALYGLEDARGYEAMTFAPLMETYQLWSVHQPVFFNRVDDLSKPFLSLINVRYAFGDAATPVPPGWRVLARKGEAVLLENPQALERAFVPRIVNIGLARSLIIELMKDVTDFRERAWITAAEVTPYERANGPGRVTIRNAKHGYELDADMEGDGWIVVTNSAWKGWRAYLDGRRVRMQRANAAFLAIYTPKGRHSIRLVYWPDAFVRGRAVSLAALVAIGVFALIRRRRAAGASGQAVQ